MVFNGYDSVLWNNLRVCFANEIRTMYKSIRAAGSKISYDYIDTLYDNHQAKWPERMWNEDAFNCYINPLVTQGINNLPMLLGNKKQQRKYWLYNRFKYMDSKYVAADALSERIQLRSYAGADAPNCQITITPFADIYGTVNWANAAGDENLTQARITHGQSHTFNCPLTDLNDTEVYIYSCDQLLSVGDLSRLQIDYCDISKAKNLSEIILGSSATGWTNPHTFATFTVGNLPLLKKINMINCTGYSGQPDLSGCPSIEEVYMDNTQTTGVVLPDAAPIVHLHLPNTVTYLGLKNITTLTDFVLEQTTQITNLDIWNIATSVFDTDAALQGMADRSIVRWVGAEWGTQQVPIRMIDFLTKVTGYYNKFRGPDSAEHCDLRGGVWVQSYTAEQLESLHAMFPDIELLGSPPEKVAGRFYNDDTAHTFITEVFVNKGDKVDYGASTPEPTKEPTISTTYTFDGWSDSTHAHITDKRYRQAIQVSTNITAHYAESIRQYLIRFLNSDSTVLESKNVDYNVTPTYTGTTPIDPTGEGKAFSGWTPTLYPANKNQDYTAFFNETDASVVKAFIESAVNSDYRKRIALIDDSITKFTNPYLSIPVQECTEITMPNLGKLYDFNTTIISSGLNFPFCVVNCAYPSYSNYYKCSKLVVDIDNFQFAQNVYSSASGLFNSMCFHYKDTRSYMAEYRQDLCPISNYEGQDLDLISQTNYAAGGIYLLANSVTSYHNRYSFIITGGVKKIILPNCIGTAINGNIRAPYGIEYIDLGNCARIDSGITVHGTGEHDTLQDVYLRKEDSICTLAYTGLGFKNENLKVHVPYDLIETYQTATNWSAAEAYYQDTYHRSLFVEITEEEKAEHIARVERQKDWMRAKEQGITAEEWKRSRGEIE